MWRWLGPCAGTLSNKSTSVFVIYRYEIAEFPDVLEHVSPWCSLFSEDNLKILEFADDLKYYWKDGYGFDINRKMTQPLMAEMHQKLSQLK